MKTGRWGRPDSLNLLVTGNFPVITETQLEVTAAAKRPHSTREEAERKGTNKHVRPQCHWSVLINSFICAPKSGLGVPTEQFSHTWRTTEPRGLSSCVSTPWLFSEPFRTLFQRLTSGSNAWSCTNAVIGVFRTISVGAPPHQRKDQS